MLTKVLKFFKTVQRRSYVICFDSLSIMQESLLKKSLRLVISDFIVRSC